MQWLDCLLFGYFVADGVCIHDSTGEDRMQLIVRKRLAYPLLGMEMQ